MKVRTMINHAYDLEKRAIDLDGKSDFFLVFHTTNAKLLDFYDFKKLSFLCEEVSLILAEIMTLVNQLKRKKYLDCEFIDNQLANLYIVRNRLEYKRQALFMVKKKSRMIAYA
ncbi:MULTISPECIES: hypothetical protein [unclassified Enterococcus]|uniref:hypothetical protein n=1 Tax=unclassified Enterococcus TaxID=2608891 RepID=UPI0015569A36|nr:MULTISPECIES: hypothetical protein [unclassified Enterococcus]MBS7576961.1 hypothetical protein [Enterococcus sp. MMGLQ5-2]MBS7584368.1 hypothetical protein [Enterococcus sp. MMGLQ5-1]NPD12223.1 hypothetical protein [Enterococcus sp. MMGLQ5-1]NPD36795.1 hypothetical protein [Enterococcus sp. MMGLQ5-2]